MMWPSPLLTTEGATTDDGKLALKLPLNPCSLAQTPTQSLLLSYGAERCPRFGGFTNGSATPKGITQPWIGDTSPVLQGEFDH